MPYCALELVAEIHGEDDQACWLYYRCSCWRLLSWFQGLHEFFDFLFFVHRCCGITHNRLVRLQIYRKPLYERQLHLKWRNLLCHSLLEFGIAPQLIKVNKGLRTRFLSVRTPEFLTRLLGQLRTDLPSFSELRGNSLAVCCHGPGKQFL